VGADCRDLPDAECTCGRRPIHIVVGGGRGGPAGSPGGGPLYWTVSPGVPPGSPRPPPAPRGKQKGQMRYKNAERRGHLPPGWTFVEVAGVAVDSKDRVYVFNRGVHPVIVFDRDGRFLASWGEGVFQRAHGITIGPDDAVYCTDDLDHTVRKFTPEGKLLLTFGTS